MDNQMKQNQPEPTESLIDIAEPAEEEAPTPTPLQECKEFVSLESGTIKLSLGSSCRPVEFLCDLLLDLKSKLNNGSVGTPGYC